MKFRAVFFYTAFVVVASVIAIAVSGGDVSIADIARVRWAQSEPAREEIAPALVESSGAAAQENRAAACALNARCPDCNVILLSVDSLRADHVGAYGYARDTTPYFDELAKTGALFENYFSSSFLTPVSEMSVHTGMYPSAHMVTNFDTVLPEEITTIAEYMSRKGYFTSTLLSSPEFEINPALKKSFSRGFKRYEYIKADQTMPYNGLRAFPSQSQLAKEMGEIENKKFFWWVGVGGVHWPYGGQGKDVFADPAYQGILKNTQLDWAEFQNIYKKIYYPQKIHLSDADIQYVRDQYDNGVRAFDEFFERFVSELARQNLLNHTLIVIQSEHGEGLHENGYFAHYDILDTQTHVPLLIISPGLSKGCRVASFAGSADVFPTIAELLGHEGLEQFQGKSLAPVIRGDEKDGMRQEVFLERNPLWEETKAMRMGLESRGVDVGNYRHTDIGIRTPRWKYIARTSSQAMEKINWWQIMTGIKSDFPEAELYDLVNDPGETANVIDRYPEEAAALEKRLREWAGAIIPVPGKEPDRVPTIQPYF